MKYVQFFIGILIILTGFSNVKAEMEQDYRIVKDGEDYTVLGIADSKSYFKSEHAHQTIQFAIDKLGERGGQVVVSRGDFPLVEPVNMKDRIHLLGSGRATRLLVTESNSSGIGVICKGLNGFIISNLALTAGDNQEARMGILIDDCGDSRVQEVFSVGFAEYGISMQNNSFLIAISGCHLAGNKKANLHCKLLTKGRIGNFLPNLVSDCVIYGGGKGIELSRVIVMNISDCIVHQTKEPAFHLHSRTTSVLITGCRTFQITGPAVLVERCNEFNCSANIFCWQTEQGILVKGSNWGTITGNEIMDSGSYNSGEVDEETHMEDLPPDLQLYDGIELSDVHGYHVGGNTIFNWKVAPLMRNGISEDNTSSKNIIVNNNINYYSEADVVSEGKETYVQGNVSEKDESHEEMKGRAVWIQSFKTEWTDQYIDIQKK
jgi:hypothetical protein